MTTALDPDLEPELLGAAQRGDPVALERLLALVAPRLHRFGVRLCGQHPDADDVLQESLLAVARALPQFSGRSSLSSWLYAIARSFCVKQRRRRVGQPARVESLDAVVGLPSSDEAEPEAALDRRERFRAVQAALATLPDEQREAVVLRDLEGLSAEEAARVLELGVPALKSRLHRGRAALRDALAPVLGPVARPSPGCPDILALHSAKLEGDVSPEICAEVEAHVRGCARCATACASLQEALRVCRESGPELPAGLSERVRAALRGALRSRVP